MARKTLSIRILALQRGLEPLGQRLIGRMVAEEPAPHSKHRVGGISTHEEMMNLRHFVADQPDPLQTLQRWEGVRHRVLSDNLRPAAIGYGHAVSQGQDE